MLLVRTVIPGDLPPFLPYDSPPLAFDLSLHQSFYGDRYYTSYSFVVDLRSRPVHVRTHLL